jgi:ribosome-associated protein
MDIRKLQRTIVDALEDVKAQDIQVFNTEHLTSLFDRVIVASGTSNRQTRSLAASVRDKVRAAGGTVKNPEGEGSGEWVLVDCGDAVVHIMQPVIRAYYKLEDIWGGKSVHLKARPQAASASKGSRLRQGDASSALPGTKARAGQAEKTGQRGAPKPATKAPTRAASASKPRTQAPAKATTASVPGSRAAAKSAAVKAAKPSTARSTASSPKRRVAAKKPVA